MNAIRYKQRILEFFDYQTTTTTTAESTTTAETSTTAASSTTAATTTTTGSTSSTGKATGGNSSLSYILIGIGLGVLLILYIWYKFVLPYKRFVQSNIALLAGQTIAICLLITGMILHYKKMIPGQFKRKNSIIDVGLNLLFALELVFIANFARGIAEQYESISEQDKLGFARSGAITLTYAAFIGIAFLYIGTLMLDTSILRMTVFLRNNLDQIFSFFPQWTSIFLDDCIPN